jgi:predicted O-linked N-acetylglucosamine transferase (SPINDLY family)
MVMLSASDRQRENIERTFAEAGVERDRLEFVTPARRGEYLRMYDRIDVCLDPLVYNGITTSCDALWMGVPVISRVGETAPGRAGMSILMNLGLGEWVAESDEAFVHLAAELADDREGRNQLRASLRGRMEGSVMMDGERFAREVEGAFGRMM